MLGLSPFVTGLIIVAVGTSLPELVAGIVATAGGNSGIVAGNVFGANISNLLLILGLITLFSKKSIELGEAYIFIDLHFMLGSMLMLCLFMWDGSLSTGEGLLLLAGFVVYQVHLINSEKVPEAEVNPRMNYKNRVHFLWLITGGLGVYAGAELTVDALTKLSTAAGISQTVISATVLSLGTTLPEMAVSLSAVREGKTQIALGNILGSCIFNAFMVMGAASLFGPVHLAPDVRSLVVAFAIGAALFFYLLSQDRRVNRFEGILFILFYITFVLKFTAVV